MANETTTLLKLIGGKSNVRVDLGFFRELDGMRAVIDSGGGRIPAEFATDYEPEVNEQIQVLWVDGKPYLLGAAVPKPSTGVVFTAPAGDYVVVDTAIGQVTATYNVDLALSSGQQVRIHWGGGPYVGSVMSTTPDVAPAPPPSVGTGTRQEVFTAIAAGSWQSNGSRWVDGGPRASNGYLGAWHYGTKIADTVPASAQLISVEVFVRYTSRFGNAPNFALHNQASRGGAPSLSSAFAWGAPDGWQRLPSAQEAVYFNSLKAGGGAFGIGLDHGGVNRFASLASDPQSGAIRITWRT